MSPRNVVVSGMMAADPYQGGATWAVLQYVLGLRQLGHRVEFIESIQARDLIPAGSTLAASRNAAYFRDILARFGIDGYATLLMGTETVGRAYDELARVMQNVDVLLNISGLLADERLLEPVPVRAFLDLDPAFNQMWHAYEHIDRGLAAHTHFVTIGQLVGTPGNVVPTCGVDWITTWQPVVLSEWPVATALERDAFTTVANWRGYGSITHDGVRYGQKAHALRPFFDLPQRATARFELALSIHPDEVADLEALRHNGWRLSDPAAVAGTPWDYQTFIQGSKAEFGIAKEGYVRSRCGWFSDRSVCYLASGRPVIAQETGFSELLPTGEGLFAFETQGDVMTAIADIDREYPRHRAAARRLAEQYFDSTKVLPRLLDKLSQSS